jgi:Zn-dependent protease
MSHAILARRRGVEVKSIVISFFGGATPFDASSPDPGDDLAIAVAGPAVSIAIGGVLGIAAVALNASGGTVGLAGAQVLAVLAVLNLALGLVNVVPAYPLDGGRIVRAIAWRRTGDVKDGWRAAGTVGRFVGLAIIAIGLGVVLTGQLTNGAMIALSGWFLLLSARAIRERVKVDEMIGDLFVRDVMERDVPSVHPGLTVDTFAAQLLDGEVPTTAIPVLADDEVVGILGVRQVKGLRPDKWATTRVEDVMAKPPRLPVVGKDDSLVVAVERLQRSGLDGLPVVDDGRLVGVLTRRSIGLAVQARTARDANTDGRSSAPDETGRNDTTE